MFFQIRTVDINGHNGRDYLPSPSDIGLVVRPVKMETFVYHSGGHYDRLPDNPLCALEERNRVALLDQLPADSESYVETCFTCLTEDGRLLDLMDFELEPLKKDYASYRLDKAAADPRD